VESTSLSQIKSIEALPSELMSLQVRGQSLQSKQIYPVPDIDFRGALFGKMWGGFSHRTKASR